MPTARSYVWALTDARCDAHPTQNLANASSMKMRKKSELPSKICLACGLAFTWRKKWARDWDQVKFCSERCRHASPKPAGGA
jgi:hypothetical protein